VRRLLFAVCRAYDIITQRLEDVLGNWKISSTSTGTDSGDPTQHNTTPTTSNVTTKTILSISGALPPRSPQHTGGSFCRMADQADHSQENTEYPLVARMLA
jgi:hypothetical protein